MKRRVRKIANFFAFNLLFFALYLNFIHKDNVGVTGNNTTQNTSAFSGTVPVDNPEQLVKKTEANTSVAVQGTEKPASENSTVLKLSIN
jgi:hypothetical protein